MQKKARLGQKWLKYKARPSARSRCTNPFCLLTWLGKCQFDLLGSKASSPNFFRDAGNVGPSVGRALDNFDGGRCLKKSCIRRLEIRRQVRSGPICCRHAPPTLQQVHVMDMLTEFCMTPSPPIAPDSLFGKTLVRAVISSATEQSKEGENAECPPEHIDYIKANDMVIGSLEQLSNTRNLPR